jgi:excisionase family DNA binding protein
MPYAQRDEILTVTETADRLRISRAGLYTLIRDGEIKPFHFGGLTLFNSSEVERAVRRGMARQ